MTLMWMAKKTKVTKKHQRKIKKDKDIHIESKKEPRAQYEEAKSEINVIKKAVTNN